MNKKRNYLKEICEGLITGIVVGIAWHGGFEPFVVGFFGITLFFWKKDYDWDIKEKVED